MSDVMTVRAELKAWEREFKSAYGREPSIDDIKAQPAIAVKYKLYKRLAKSASATAAATTSTSWTSTALSPVTPPRPSRSKPPAKELRDPTRLKHQANSGRADSATLLPKARAVHTTTSPSTSNPFSPVKHKGKQRQDLPRASDDFNPFSSPTKSMGKPKRTASSRGSSRGATPDPFSDAPGPPSSASSSKKLFPPAFPIGSEPASTSDAAIVRARKRLRGEPVSPSPKKEKRQRVLSGLKGSLSGKSLVFPKAGPPLLPDSACNVSDDDDGRDDAFVADSPAKLPAADRDKDFKLLFEEPLAAPAFDSGTLLRHAAATKTSTKQRRTPADSLSDIDIEGDDLTDLTMKINSETQAKSSSRKVNNSVLRRTKGIIPGAHIPGKDNLYANGPAPLKHEASPPLQRGRNAANAKGPSGLPQPLQKRAYSQSTSGAEVDEEIVSTATSGSISTSTSATLVSGVTLLPPSPPPAGGKAKTRYRPAVKPNRSDMSKVKGGDRVKVQESADARKKRRMSSDAETPPESVDEHVTSGDSSDELAGVRVLDWGSSQRALFGAGGEDSGALSDFDPEFDFSLSRRTARRVDATALPRAEENRETMEVDLPDNLQKLLAFSPAGVDAVGSTQRRQRKDREEERIARAVLSGRRLGHYDASKGGEIWDVGEAGEEGELEADLGRNMSHKPGVLTDDNDDWEDEGVPWEVGEL